MKGKILGFDPIDGGFIRSENHNRSLLSSDWMGSHAQNAEDVVNSDVDREVYPLQTGRHWMASIVWLIDRRVY
jgi:hypothetical protein